MNKMCIAHFGLLLLALHLLSSQVVQAQGTTAPSMTMTMSNYSMTSAPMLNETAGDKNGSGSINAFTLLLPLALAASVLHGWS